MKNVLYENALALLQKLISVPSFSREEDQSASVIADFFAAHHHPVQRFGNNLLASAKKHDAAKPTLMLNSHHDTVRPVSGWTKDPFLPLVEDGKLYGLGSNDAGASLCALTAAFFHFAEKEELPFNLLIAATAEEEISGKNGIASLLPEPGEINAAIVGEPTGMKLAVAEKGLLVLDACVRGKAGHAAREEGENAIYKALPVIEWFRDFRFPEKSKWLGETKMSVTMLSAGSQHNVVPDECRFTIDVRVTDAYTHEEALAIIRSHVSCELVPRSMRLRSSFISETHPLVLAGKNCGMECFGSATLSDQALLPFPSVKTGPGDSARSHTADEFIFLHELEDGIEKYVALIEETGRLMHTVNQPAQKMMINS